jgi:type III pantothenate kinase
MLIVLDVGNTNTTIGVYDRLDLRHSWRLTSDRQRTMDEYGILCRTLLDMADIARCEVTAMAISSVVPPLDFTLNKMAEVYFSIKPLFVTHENCGMPILYDDPNEVGPDRLVNAVAAFTKYGGPCITVDFGTATTFDAVSQAGEYMGGIIYPGIQISAEALFQRAARLRRVDMRRPDRLIGTNPTGSMQSGLYYGNVALVDGVLERMIEEMGPTTRVIATGGLASLISRGARRIQTIDADLTLEGLRIVFERVSSQQA